MTCANCCDGICQNMCLPNQASHEPMLFSELKIVTAETMFTVVLMKTHNQFKITLCDQDGDLVGLIERARPMSIPTMQQGMHFSENGPTIGSNYKSYSAEKVMTQVRCENYLVPVYELRPAERIQEKKRETKQRNDGIEEAEIVPTNQDSIARTNFVARN